MPRVSLCIIAKNEEHRLGKCLASAVDLVNETIVVDTGSTDATKQIAVQHAAKVFDFPWCDDFSAAMNACLDHASGDWIFWLHADHWLDETNRDRLRRLFADLREENVAYFMKWQSPPRMAEEPGVVIDTIHLFRNRPDIRWKNRVHEQIRPAIQRAGGTTRFSDVVIYHSGYADPVEHQAKLVRNLHLLQLDAAEHPTDVAILFHLGWTLYLLGRPADAIDPLRRSLVLCEPGQTILRKNYALLVRSLRALWRQPEAFEVCHAGRTRFPNDPELLFHEGQLRREGGDFVGAERVLQQLLQEPLESFVACGYDVGLKGFKARCALAEVYRDQGRVADAEREFRAVLADHPELTPAWLCLGDMWLNQQRFADVDQLASQLQSNPKTAIDGALLQGRSLMIQKRFAESRALIEQIIARAPKNIWPRELLAHCLHFENRDLPALATALRNVLTLDATNQFALANLPNVEQRLQAAQ